MGGKLGQNDREKIAIIQHQGLSDIENIIIYASSFREKASFSLYMKPQ